MDTRQEKVNALRKRLEELQARERGRDEIKYLKKEIEAAEYRLKHPIKMKIVKGIRIGTEKFKTGFLKLADKVAEAEEHKKKEKKTRPGPFGLEIEGW